MPCGPRSGLWDWLALQAAALQSGPSHSLAACFLGPDVPRAGLCRSPHALQGECVILFSLQSLTPLCRLPLHHGKVSCVCCDLP